uniref:Uncharacterized protein LOC111127236 isoform X4 n=1 Tax=Crassostrea virginica TaxID=6565 RepID=A0A8B8DIS2_CRAVI|nr:uncharacterized protein LOC111127236 isoform X4 [Crassostrea virginica]
MEMNTGLFVFLVIVLKNFKVNAECSQTTDTTTEEKQIGDCLSLACESKNDFVYWEHYGGWNQTLLRTFSTPNITLSNISYLDTGKYICVAKESVCLRSVSLNVQAPNKNVTIKECEMGKKETVVRADTVLTFLKVSLNNSDYQINGYLMKASLNLKTMTKNNYLCIEVYLSNKNGNVSIPFQMKANVNNSENGGTILHFLRENIFEITLGGIALLIVLILMSVVVLCRRIKKVEQERVCESTKQDTHLGTLSSRTYKSFPLRNPEPEACQGTGPCPFWVAAPSEDTLPEQDLGDDTSVSDSSGLYSFVQSESESEEKYNDVA